MRIEVDVDSMYESGSGSILGAIRLVFDGEAFPSEGWTDFVVVILGWWIVAMRGVLDPRGRQATLRFMDGPYAVRVHRDRSGRATFVAIRDGGKEQVVMEGPLDLRGAAQELARAAHAVRDRCVERGWESSDVDSLGMAVTWLEEELAR